MTLPLMSLEKEINILNTRRVPHVATRRHFILSDFCTFFVTMYLYLIKKKMTLPLMRKFVEGSLFFGKKFPKKKKALPLMSLEKEINMLRIMDLARNKNRLITFG
jgi:hypothetical protein